MTEQEIEVAKLRIEQQQSRHTIWQNWIKILLGVLAGVGLFLLYGRYERRLEIQSMRDNGTHSRMSFISQSLFSVSDPQELELIYEIYKEQVREYGGTVSTVVDSLIKIRLSDIELKTDRSAMRRYLMQQLEKDQLSPEMRHIFQRELDLINQERSD